MNRLDWTDWIRNESTDWSARDRREFIIAYGEWLEERLQVLDEQGLEALANEFYVS